MFLIRFYLLIPLLVSLIYVKASQESSRVAGLTPSPEAMQFQQPSYSLAKNAEPKSRGMQRRRETWTDPTGKSVPMIISSPNHSAMLLAQKLAQDALRSKETQDTIKELSSLKDEHKPAEVSNTTEKAIQSTEKIVWTTEKIIETTAKVIQTTEEVVHSTTTPHKTEPTRKTTVKSKAHSRHKGHEKRKHKKHKKQDKKHHHPKRRLKRLNSKKESSKTARRRKSSKLLNVGGRRRLRKKSSLKKSAVTRRRKRSNKIEQANKRSDQKLGENLEATKNGDENSIKELPNFESTHRKYRKIPISLENKNGNEKDSKFVPKKRSHMIAKLMQTTTRDPTKKKPGDQGAEYSEYYSDNENILPPEIRAQSKLNDVAGDTMSGEIRSIRETEDGNIMEPDYYDSPYEQQLQEDIDRLKRNNEKSLNVMEAPSNPMEYVDNTYEPALANGVINNDKLLQYPSSYNYVPDQNMQSSGLRVPIADQFLQNSQAEVGQNPPIIGSSLNMIPSMGNLKPMLHNVKSGQPSFLGNVELSQSPQQHFADNHFPYYSIKRLTSSPTTNSLTAKSLSGIANEQENERLVKLNVDTNSSISGFNPTPSYDTLSENNRVMGTEIPGRGTPVVRVTPKPLYANPSPSMIAFDSLESFPRLRDKDVKYFNYNDGVENFQGPAQIESIASREIQRQVTPVKTGTSKRCNSTTTEESTSASTSKLTSTLALTSKLTSSAASTLKSTHTSASESTSSSTSPSSITSSSATPMSSSSASPMSSSSGSSTPTSSSTSPSTSPSTTSISTSTSTPSLESDEANKHSVSNATISVTHNLVSTTSSLALLTVASSVTPPVNRTSIMNDTKAVASEILSEIIGELEELRLENPQNEQKEGLPCKLTGSWVTARAGVRIDMNVTNHSIKVSLDHLTPPVTNEALLNVTWNVTGFAPFKRGGPFTLLATNNHTKTLAIFVGACKVCQGIDTIEGLWTVSREPRDCRDFQMSTSIVNEIFRRTRLFSAIKEKQSKSEVQLSSTTNGNSSSTTESTNTVHELLDNQSGSHNHTLSFIGVE